MPKAQSTTRTRATKRHDLGSLPAKLYGWQLRAARAAADLRIEVVVSKVRMSMHTLNRLEHAGRIDFGVRKRGLFEEETVAKLVSFYRERGITFTGSSPRGLGIRYLPQGE